MFRFAIAVGTGMTGMVAQVSISLTAIMPGWAAHMPIMVDYRSAGSMTPYRCYKEEI